MVIMDPTILAQAAAAVTKAGPPVAKTTPYDPEAAKKENGGVLPMDHERSKGLNEGDIPFLRFLTKQVTKNLVIREVWDDKDNVLARVRVIDGGAFAPDMAVDVNDKAIKITSKDGYLSVSGRPDLKFVDVNVDTGKKTERLDLFNPGEISPIKGKAADGTEVTQPAKHKIDHVYMLTAKGTHITVGTNPIGNSTTMHHGAANVDVLLHETGKKKPVIYITNPSGDYKVTLHNPATRYDGIGGKRDNTLSVGEKYEKAVGYTIVGDYADSFELKTVTPSSLTLDVKYNNRKTASMELYKDGKAGAAFTEEPKTKGKPHRSALIHRADGNVQDLFNAAKNGAFESEQLPPPREEAAAGAKR